MNSFGQHFIVGLEKPELTIQESELLSKIQPLGIILFGRNFALTNNWKEITKKLISDAKQSSRNSIRMVSVDFEGGRVNRFPEDIKRFPYAQEWVNNSYQVSLEMGKILKDLGFNLTYGPVADVDLNPYNPVIGKRAFSSDPKIVATACLSYKKAYDELGIITCAKHFPGHGRTFQDSHLELPKVDCCLTELENDLLPFKELIKDNIKMIMTSHVVYKCLDNTYPASLSYNIQTNFLRKNLGFNGLIVTDDMDMRALSHLSSIEKTLLALKSGTDLLLFGNGLDGKALETVNNIYESILNGYVDSELIQIHTDSLKRINVL